MPVQFEPILIKALLVGARVSMLMVFAPFLGSSAIPKKAKAGLTLALTALLYPAYSAAPKSMAAGDWLMLVPGELVIGLLIGLSVQIVFDGVQLAGEIVGFQLGFSLETAIDPTTLATTPVLSLFHQSIALLIFLQLDAHFWVLRALAHSFVILPPGSVGVNPEAAKVLLDAAGGIFWIGVQMAAPVLIVTFLIDLALSYVGRAASQFQVLFVGMAMKDVLGFAILSLCIAYWPGILAHDFYSAAGLMERLFRLSR